MAEVKTVCLHKNCVLSGYPLQVKCPDCEALLGEGTLINTLMQRVAALERAIEYLEEKEFKFG